MKRWKITYEKYKTTQLWAVTYTRYDNGHEYRYHRIMTNLFEIFKYSKAALYCWYRDREYEKLGKVNPYVISFHEHRP